VNQNEIYSKIHSIAPNSSREQQNDRNNSDKNVVLEIIVSEAAASAPGRKLELISNLEVLIISLKTSDH
jgi:hypothetical protein